MLASAIHGLWGTLVPHRDERSVSFSVPTGRVVVTVKVAILAGPLASDRSVRGTVQSSLVVALAE